MSPTMGTVYRRNAPGRQQTGARASAFGEIESVLRRQADVARRAAMAARREDTSPRLFREFGFVDRPRAPRLDRAQLTGTRNSGHRISDASTPRVAAMPRKARRCSRTREGSAIALQERTTTIDVAVATVTEQTDCGVDLPQNTEGTCARHAAARLQNVQKLQTDFGCQAQLSSWRWFDSPHPHNGYGWKLPAKVDASKRRQCEHRLIGRIEIHNKILPWHQSHSTRDRLHYRVTHTHLRDGFGIATAFAK